MTDTITLTGLVGTKPRHVSTGDGLDITSFRLATTHRRFDRAERKWVDAGTNWFTVTAFRTLATNAELSLQTGQRVIVTGRLKLRDWTTDEKSGTSVEIEAEAIGHDLSWGSSVYTRSVTGSGGSRSGDDAGVGSAGDGSVSADALSADAAGGVDADGWASPGALSDTAGVGAATDEVPLPF
ncbi:single-stranded DNA-binding protein [Schumannella sp. 10F1B-5-1]|uniref:single-stranded DNA-binding protein n=1 Tax=Schumannella sp. 10F1B-5-1 TaxID=2590780 RepID=UPI00113097C2|nr:single-stranded DNA-binding protein [Schumannella sp. 10F1B-5-1]TPW70097.1 single-stranded DNA-binding protein [Schumannella sp. 10F1B-5-1]